MEFFTVLLSGLLLLISPVGIVVDQVAEDAIRSRLVSAESLDVRIDNGPSFQLLQGRVDRVRIAGRGLSPYPGLRLAVAELETDPIDLAFNSLRKGEVVLDQPLQAAARLVLTETDLNAFLRSPIVDGILDQVQLGSLNPAQARERDRYQISNPSIQFLTDNRLKVSVVLEDLVQSENLQLEAETALSISGGDRLILTKPILIVNGQPAPQRLVDTLLGNVNERLSLKQLESRGITARVLDFSLEAEELSLAMWVRVDPSVTTGETMGEAALPR